MSYQPLAKAKANANHEGPTTAGLQPTTAGLQHEGKTSARLTEKTFKPQGTQRTQRKLRGTCQSRPQLRARSKHSWNSWIPRRTFRINWFGVQERVRESRMSRNLSSRRNRFQKKPSEVATSLPFPLTCFEISRNQVAELVAATILVATSGHLKDGCRIHAVDFCSAISVSCFQRVTRAHAG